MIQKKDPELGVGYIRYSSEMQSGSFSLEAQKRQILERARQDEVVIVKFYADEAMSAYHQKRRPGITQMLQDATKGMFDVVYVHKIDRLARRLEWALEIIRHLGQAGVSLRAVEQRFDLTTPEGKLLFSFLGALGEFYSDNLSAETHKGKYERAMQGLHNGWAPIGYHSVKVNGKKQAVPDEKIAPYIREAFERCATGLYYDQEIADWLNEQGIRTLRGRPFTKDAVRTILTNSFYYGMVRYTGAYIQRQEGSAKEIMIKGQHEPIITQKLFERCQQARAARRARITNRQFTRRTYLLNGGLLVCAHCGLALRAQSTVHGHRYYRDTARDRGATCPHSRQSVRADVVEAQVGFLIRNLQLPEGWENLVEAMLAKEQEQQPDPQKEKAHLRAKLKRLRKMYARGLYANDESAFWREVEAIQTRLKILDRIEPASVQTSAQQLLNIAAAWQQATAEERRELVQMLFQKVVVNLAEKRIIEVTPRPEYRLLFRTISGMEMATNGAFRITDPLTMVSQSES
ncbi:MAG: recombinase family protein [Candidatus Diapherotrites archaeon]|nr:recombinase family protein [Candidatus Diapherotrites archaeon]